VNLASCSALGVACCAMAGACGGDHTGAAKADPGAAFDGGDAASSGGMPGAGAARDGSRSEATDSSAGRLEYVFVVALENHDDEQVVGDTENAPYLNETIAKYARSSNFVDVLALAILSEPHYVILEAGTSSFADVTFDSDADPSASNSTASTAHLVTQMKDARPAVSFMSYQEGLDAETGDCPIHSSGAYAPKHDPLVFFQDVVGSPPSASSPYCIAHHAPMTQLAEDLRSGAVAKYVFVTPDLCHDMHGADGCADSNRIRSGDDWLKEHLPPLESFANEHRGVVFIVWDEGDATRKLPFVALGPTVKRSYVSTVRVTHASITKTVERIFALPILEMVKEENDLADMFEVPFG
jgi:hypothetical protein